MWNVTKWCCSHSTVGCANSTMLPSGAAVTQPLDAPTVQCYQVVLQSLNRWMRQQYNVTKWCCSHSTVGCANSTMLPSGAAVTQPLDAPTVQCYQVVLQSLNRGMRQQYNVTKWCCSHSTVGCANSTMCYIWITTTFAIKLYIITIQNMHYLLKAIVVICL
ncbi:hypothetical protein LSAT2_014797 [Lamellibrachia satsuma]|nr:hypothetical protein LSAT2_014797 [Lamellibrachia satsuma]